MGNRTAFLGGLLAIATLAANAHAQFALWKHHGASGTSLYGMRVRAAGDLNGDGSPDCIAVEPLLFGSSNPVVNAYSGKDGTTIHALSFPQGPNGLGLAIGAGADYTGDGVPDILLGSPGANAPPAIGLPSSPFGGVYIYSGKTGQFARARLGNGIIGFGTQIWCMPDVNSDGIADYAVLVGGPAAAGLASVQVISGSDDALLASISALQAFDGFGLSFEVFDDFTGDGIPDFAMGAPYHQANGIVPGMIRFFSGASGAEYPPLIGVNDADVVGLAIASLGDSDGDSNPEFATNLGGLQVQIREVFPGGMPPIIVQQTSPSAAGFGHPMKSITDLDGDGRRELIAREVDSIVAAKDSVRVINTSSGKSLYRYVDAYSPVGQFHLFAYPSSLEVIGDVTGDGIDEWIQGFEDYPAQPPIGRGIAEVVSIQSMLATPTVIHPPIGPPVQLKLTAGVEFAGASYFVLASYTGTAGLTLWNVPVPLHFDGLTELSIVFANTAAFGQTFGTLSSEGTATAFFNGAGLPPIADGLSFSFAAFVLDGSTGAAMATTSVTTVVQF